MIHRKFVSLDDLFMKRPFSKKWIMGFTEKKLSPIKYKKGNINKNKKYERI